jgi:hypothetical protein
LRRNEFRSNHADEFGPAVYNGFNTLVETADNTACGNVAERKSMRCEGIFVSLGRQRLRCEPFANECDMPSSQPSSVPSLDDVLESSSYPSVMPSLVLPSGSPSLVRVNQNQNELESAIPSDMPSLIPNDLSSLVPSGSPSLVAVEQNELDSTIPSDMPSLIPSDLPSLVPSDMPTGDTIKR